MSSKAAKRKKEFEQRQAKRKAKTERDKLLRRAPDIEEMARILGVKLR